VRSRTPWTCTNGCHATGRIVVVAVEDCVADEVVDVEGDLAWLTVWRGEDDPPPHPTTKQRQMKDSRGSPETGDPRDEESGLDMITFPDQWPRERWWLRCMTRLLLAIVNAIAVAHGGSVAAREPSNGVGAP
jgi:hypothetical protein